MGPAVNIVQFIAPPVRRSLAGGWSELGRYTAQPSSHGLLRALVVVAHESCDLLCEFRRNAHAAVIPSREPYAFNWEARALPSRTDGLQSLTVLEPRFGGDLEHSRDASYYLPHGVRNQSTPPGERIVHSQHLARSLVRVCE